MWASPQRTSMTSGRRCPKSFALCRCRRGSEAPGASSRWSTERSWRMGAAAARVARRGPLRPRDGGTGSATEPSCSALGPTSRRGSARSTKSSRRPRVHFRRGVRGPYRRRGAALMRDWPACDPRAGLSPPTIHRPDRSHSYHLRPRAERRLRRVRPADRDGRARFGLRTSQAFPWSHRR
jgi:hypothetical protein